MHDLISDIITARKTISTAISELKATDYAKLVAIFDELFETSPSVGGIRFQIYTPSFNDGDPCYTRVSDIMVSSTKSPNDFNKKKTNENIAAVCQPLGIGADQLVELFGDDREITIQRGKITVDYYDCGY